MAQKVIKKGKSKKASRLSGRFITLAMTIIFVIACPFVYFSILSYRNKQAAESKMATYLSKKYQEDFVVEKPECKGGGIGIECSWKSKAHPVSNPETKFNVSCVFSDTPSPSSCSDQYVAALWSVQANKELGPIVKSIYGESQNIKMKSKIVLSGDLVETATKTSPTYDQAKSYESGSGFHYKIEADMKEVSRDKFLDESRKVSEVLFQLRALGVKSLSLDANVDTDDGGKYFCSTSHYKNNNKFPDDINLCHEGGGS